MKGPMQAALAPVSPPNSIEFNPLKVATQEKAADMGEPTKDLDFRTMIQNSNSDTARERAAKKSGDLSGAKTDEDFYRMLNERSNPGRTPKNQLGKDDFLKLFIAQMQNQDPLNPSDASQMAAQMAQFNGLEQMMNVNNTLNELLKSQGQGQTTQMINYVGKEVDVGTGMLKYDKNKLTKATFEIEQPLPGALLEVRDGSGQVISQQDLGSVMPGEHNVKWSGKLKDGKDALPGLYNFQIVGKTSDGNDVTVPIKSKVKVTGIDLKDEGGSFYTELGKIKIKDVTSVGVQGFDDVKAEFVPAPSSDSSPKDNTAKAQIPQDTNGLTIPAEQTEQKPSMEMPAGLPPGLMEAAQKMINSEPAPESSSSPNRANVVSNDSGIPVTVAGAN
jgi:flagellar basal-body rod modification protein FlgD